MDAQQITPLFGTRVGDARLETFLRRAGVTERPKLAKDEDDAHISVESEGIEYLFVEEGALNGEEDQPIGTGPLVFAGVFFHAEGHEGFAQFAGQLPNGLAFTDTRTDAVRKLGEPEWKKERHGVLRRERWQLPDYKLLVDYEGGGTSILVVYCGIA